MVKSFSDVLAHIQTLPDIRSKIGYLLTVRAESQQSCGSGRVGPMLSFVRKCDAEIIKQQQLLALERLDELPPPSNDEYDPAKRGLTRQFAMLLLDELFQDLKNASNAAKGELLGLLTGWNAEGLRNKWSDYRRGNPQALAEDKQRVDAWKKKLKIKNLKK